MTNETKAWLDSLKAEGGLSEEAYNSLKQSVESNPKADEHIKGSVLRQNDYSRQSAEIQKAKADAEAALRSVAEKEAKLTNYQGQLGTWKAEAEVSFRKALADSEAANIKAQKAVARLATIQVKYGVPEEDVKLDDVDIPAMKTQVGDSKSITEDDIKRIVGGGMREAGILDAMIYDLGAEHQRLFGTPLPKAAQLVQEALAANKPLTEYWKDKYKVVERTSQLAEQEYQTRLKNDVETELAKRLSGSSLPGGMMAGNIRPDLANSPVLQKPFGTAPSPDSEGGGVSAAIAAFRSGKFAVKR